MARAARDSEFESFETNSGDEDSAGIELEEGEGLVDLSSTDDSGGEYPVLKRGIYDAELIEMEYGRSQASNNRMWTTIWELTDPDLAVKGHQPRQWLHLTFNEGGMPRVKRALARMVVEDGYNLELLKGSFNPEKVADEGRLIGAKARLRVTIRRYEGKNRNNVQELLPPAGGAGASQDFANL